MFRTGIFGIKLKFKPWMLTVRSEGGNVLVTPRLVMLVMLVFLCNSMEFWHFTPSVENLFEDQKNIWWPRGELFGTLQVVQRVASGRYINKYPQINSVIHDDWKKFELRARIQAVSLERYTFSNEFLTFSNFASKNSMEFHVFLKFGGDFDAQS